MGIEAPFFTIIHSGLLEGPLVFELDKLGFKSLFGNLVTMPWGGLFNLPDLSFILHNISVIILFSKDCYKNEV